jgi:glycosyltransferase involved in cell wall biosynthesis
MPRLLSVNSYHHRRGGADAVYLDHAAALAAEGFEPAFFAMRHPANQPTAWSRYFVDEIELGHDYSPLERLTKATKVVYSFEARRKLGRLLADHPVDLAHLHNVYHHLSPSILPTLHRAGIPVVLTAHDLKLACPAYRMYNRTGICEACNGHTVLNVVRHRCINESLAASAVIAVESGLHRRLDTYRKHLDKVVVPSRFFAAKFVEWGWPEDRFVHIPNFTDALQLPSDPRPGPYFLYFGRLSPEKGLLTLVRAAAAAGVAVRIAGTGPVEAEIRALAGSLGADVELVGHQSGPALHDLVRGARAVVLPSEWYENGPMSLLEGMALGTPVIGADIGGIPELLDAGTGWTFTSGSVDHLAARLEEARRTPDAALEEMGRQARQRVEAAHSRAGYVAAMLDLYAGLGVSGPRPG